MFGDAELRTEPVPREKRSLRPEPLELAGPGQAGDPVREAEGVCLQVESREDEEQSVKLAEILELLLAAGYFRARIKGLSPFDKVS